MDRNSKNQFPEQLRELEQKLKALDSMMFNNAFERGGTPYLPLSEINDVTDLPTNENYFKSQLN